MIQFLACGLYVLSFNGMSTQKYKLMIGWWLTSQAIRSKGSMGAWVERGGQNAFLLL